jgi:hypothetical protein
MKIYENILKGKVKYPPYIQPPAQDLLQQLITADLTKRLGNLHGGAEDVKRTGSQRRTSMHHMSHLSRLVLVMPVSSTSTQRKPSNTEL